MIDRVRGFYPPRHRATTLKRSRNVCPRLVARQDVGSPGQRPRYQAKVDEVTRLIVEKLLLIPTEQLKSLAEGDTSGVYADAVTRIFNLQTAAPASDEADPERSSGGRVEPFPAKARGPR